MEQTIIDFFNQATIITVGCKGEFNKRIETLVSNAEYAKISFTDMSDFTLIFSTTRKGKSTHGMAYKFHIDSLTAPQLHKLKGLLDKSEQTNKS